jgi:hypothetical protein
MVRSTQLDGTPELPLKSRKRAFVRVRAAKSDATSQEVGETF